MDLAGSERAADSRDPDRLSRMEGAEINQSLLAVSATHTIGCNTILYCSLSHTHNMGLLLTCSLFVSAERMYPFSGPRAVTHTVQTEQAHAGKESHTHIANVHGFNSQRHI